MAQSPYDSTTSQPDEISLFLQQILLRSSSDRVPAQNQETEPGLFPGRIDPGLNPGSGIWVPTNGSSSFVGTSFDNDPDEYDCESEEGVETLVEEAAQKQRNCSKRSRAAEVHNLSEKRRRSRINEKMKALQNLIPNSNKTDKASMLDEAIEYLKQLQLQVQMLTLRNGLSLYPICLPGMLPPDQISQTRMDVCERSTALMEKAISMEQCISGDTLLSLQNKQAPVANFSTLLGPKSTSEFESSFQNHLEPFQFTRSPAGVCSEMLLLSHQQLNNEWCSTSLAGHSEKQATNLKDNTIEACLSGGGADKLSSLLNGTIFSSQLRNSDNGGRLPFDDIKTESDEF